MDNWIAAFVAHCRSNALYNWIVPKKRFYVQAGQVTPQHLLPPKAEFSLSTRMSFKDWDEYCLIQGFQILEGMQLATEVDCFIPKVALRLIDMPGAKSKTQKTPARAYFAAIHETSDSNEDELTTRLSSLKEGERLGVCFKTRRNSRLEDWHAIVVSTVDGNQDEYIISLIRPFDKATGQYADISLESPEPIQLGKVKDRKLRQKLILQDGYLVNIIREDSKKDYQRALRALDHMTFNKDNMWDNRRKMLLMSNFGSTVPQVDFLATFDPDYLGPILVGIFLQCNLEQQAALKAMCAVPHGIFVLPGCGGSGKTWLCRTIMTIFAFQPVVKVEGEVETVNIDTRKLFQREKG